MCGILAYIGNEVQEDALAAQFNLVQPRGPDCSVLAKVSQKSWLGFHRLAIMDPSPAGNQPFYLGQSSLVCNGEIYNHKALAEKYDFKLKTGSDCEVIIHMFNAFGIERTCQELDGVFSFVIFDGAEFYVARDPIGIRPLFMGTRLAEDGSKDVFICSEMKGIHKHCDEILPFKPGHYAQIDERSRLVVESEYYKYDYPTVEYQDEAAVMAKLRHKLIKAVDKRMMSDRPIGCLVSGGVDSSLIAALVARHYPKGTMHTFNVGLDTGASDRAYARMVADHIGSIHHEVTITKAEALALLKETVRVCESFDTTTIRASTMQLAIAKYIEKETDIKVIFNGDVIDEASGSYVYFKNAPSNDAYQAESIRLMKEIHLYDVLRADRTISGCGLEARVPFADKAFVQFYMGIPPEMRKPRNGVEKYLLRKAFEGYLPEAVLWRPKEAFSDGCSDQSESWSTIIADFVGSAVHDQDLVNCRFEHCKPRTKEEFYYRRYFEQHYGGRAKIIPAFWMPKWCGDNVIDPSARVLTDVYRPSETPLEDDNTEQLETKPPKAIQPMKGTG
ncbi:MAG: asparagine synthase (glutamine-hydrolyzing) [Myxococcales bacterium]|nr:asparagine synthase (glutamine-hydrolyzing) [Myxococcales bacterium]|tara:strand:+ start:222 stop:1898 length:1677 start_codon:yes stop_codon:yes gene_type:complete